MMETFEEWKIKVSIGSGSFDNESFFIVPEYGSHNPIFEKAGEYVWNYQQKKIDLLKEEIKELNEEIRVITK